MRTIFFGYRGGQGYTDTPLSCWTHEENLIGAKSGRTMLTLYEIVSASAVANLHDDIGDRHPLTIAHRDVSVTATVRTAHEFGVAVADPVGLCLLRVRRTTPTAAITPVSGPSTPETRRLIATK